MNFVAECLSSWGGLVISLQVHGLMRYNLARVGKDSFHVEENNEVMRLLR